MTIRMGSREARQRFSELLGRVRYRGDTVILESSGKPMAAVVPLEMYERMIADRAEKFEVLDRLRETSPAYSADEIERDVEDAVRDVRRNAPRRS